MGIFVFSGVRFIITSNFKIGKVIKLKYISYKKNNDQITKIDVKFYSSLSITTSVLQFYQKKAFSPYGKGVKVSRTL